jgi:hypothetical protein
MSSSAPYSRKPSAVFLPQSDRPSFSPIQNNREYCSSVYFKLWLNCVLLIESVSTAIPSLAFRPNSSTGHNPSQQFYRHYIQLLDFLHCYCRFMCWYAAAASLVQLHQSQTVSRPMTSLRTTPPPPPQNYAHPRHQNDFGIAEIYR